jgi:hypothetical protein
VLVEVAIQNDWQGYSDHDMDIAWNNGDPAHGVDEITPLVRAFRDERAAALGEILGQADDFITEFLALLTITSVSHPYTCRLMHSANVVGLLAVMYYKQLRNRPRPSHVAPALFPPIPVPGHASWPSGHATQSQLIALCLDYMFSGLSGSLWTPAEKQTMRENLLVLAGRIARNREIAGLHYPSDSSAGRTLAGKLLNVLTGVSGELPPIQTFVDTVDAARAEWSTPDDAATAG